MINNRVNKLNTFQYAIQYPLVRSLQNQLSKMDYSNQDCSCFVSTDFKVKGQCIIIDLKCRPNRFIFEGIDFSLKILLNCINTHLKPIVYNDRRVFHPNIDLTNCQLISKTLRSELKSLDLLQAQLQIFEAFIRSIMEIIVNADCSFVADNLYNRKAAWHYIYNRANYKYLIMEHCPANLNKAIVGHYYHSVIQELNARSVAVQTDKNQSFWSIQSTLSKLQLSLRSQSCQYYKDDFWQRRIKTIKDERYSDNITQINEIDEEQTLSK